MNENDFDKDTLLFHQLILSFHTAAWQQMGKVTNPMTGKIETDLGSASLSIDMLDMIKNKTKNNLSKAENSFLERTISELKLNFMAEIDKKPADEEKDKLDGDSQEDDSTEETNQDNTETTA